MTPILLCLLRESRCFAESKPLDVGSSLWRTFDGSGNIPGYSDFNRPREDRSIRGWVDYSGGMVRRVSIGTNCYDSFGD